VSVNSSAVGVVAWMGLRFVVSPVYIFYGPNLDWHLIAENIRSPYLEAAVSLVALLVQRLINTINNAGLEVLCLFPQRRFVKFTVPSSYKIF
jgi:hypothetical protein